MICGWILYTLILDQISPFLTQASTCTTSTRYTTLLKKPHIHRGEQVRREYKRIKVIRLDTQVQFNKSNLLQQFLKLPHPSNIHPIYIIHALQPCIHTSMLSINLIKLINLIISDHPMFKQRFDFVRVKLVFANKYLKYEFMN